MTTNWPTKKISDCIQQFPRKMGTPLKQYQEIGKFPVIDQGLDYIGGYTDKSEYIYRDILPAIVFGDHTRAIKFIDFPFAVGADGTKVLKPKDFLDAKYFYFALMSLNIESRGYARHYSILKEKEIPIPPLPEQKRIVAKVEKLLEKIKEAKKLRAESLESTQNLLPAELHKIFEDGKEKGWEEKSLNQICEINPKKSEVNDRPDDLPVSFIPMSAVNEHLQKITFFDERKLADVKKGYTYFANNDVLLAKITPCMENGKIAIGTNLKNGIGFGTTEFHVIRARNKVLPKWIYHILRQPFFREIAKQKMTGSAGQKRVPVHFLENYKILLPSLVEQKKIVARLDSLSEKVNDLKKLQLETATDLDALEKSLLHQAFEGKL